MNDDPIATLKTFVEALRVDEQGAIHLAGRRVGHLGAEQAQAIAALALCVYEHLYSRPFPAAPDPELQSPGADLTDELERANTTQSRIESDWSLLERAPDGGVIAIRHGRSRRFMAGQFMVTNGVLPASAGAGLTAQLPSGSRTQQPGFFYCFSEGFLDANDLSPLVRLYYNVGTGGAADLVRTITTALNRYEIPFQLKVTTRSPDFVRSDNAVLYLAQDCFHAAALAMSPVLNEIESKLDPEIPLFTKRMGRGIGFAEDPGHGESFGTSRSKLVASALVAVREGDGFPYPAFAGSFAETVSAAKLNIGALYLNPGSEDSYEQPRPVSN
jgi:HopA1 effector protein family